MSQPNIEPATPRFQTGRLRPIVNQDRCYNSCKILAYEFNDKTFIKLNIVWCVNAKSCKQQKIASTFVKEMHILFDIIFQNTSNHNRFDKVFPRVDIHIPGFCKNLKRVITSVPVTKRSKAPGWKAKCRLFDSR